MHVVRPLSRHFDPSNVKSPESHGAVAWGDFNRSFHRLQRTDWRNINAASEANFAWRLLRRVIAFYAQRTGAYLDLQGKARIFAHFQQHLPPNPDIVFFGAEAGWETLLLQALLGGKGRVLLIDDDREAYERYLDAADTVVLERPKSSELGQIVLQRDRQRIEYKRENLFVVPAAAEFDIAVDWGLAEHFPGQSKLTLIHHMQQFVRPGGWHISAVPRDSWQNRIFYRAFSDELNFGYRELMTRREFERLWERTGVKIIDSVQMLDSTVVLAQR